jgi:glycosyltransferase involved in cell wall biosynthesis
MAPFRRRLVLDALTVGANFAGIGRQVMAIGRSLDEVELGLPIEVRCTGDVVAVMREEFPEGTAFRTPVGSRSRRLRRILYQQLSAALRDSSEVLLVCTGDQAPLWGRARVLLVVHDVRRFVRPESARSRSEARFYRFLVPRGIRRASRVITVSEFSRAEIRRLFGEQVDVSVVQAHPAPRPREPFEVGSDGHVLLSVGELQRYKGVDTLMEALGRVPPGVRVVCAGSREGREAELTARAERLGVGSRLSLPGWLPDEELEDLYRSCSATVSPSTYEGYGLPVAESLARGIPTIASDIPAHREVAGDAAVFFEAGNAEDLAAVIGRVCGDPGLRDSLRERALARSRELAGRSGSWGELIAAWVRSAA